MRETGIPSQAAPWASERLRNAFVVCGLSVRCCVAPGNGATPPVGARRFGGGNPKELGHPSRLCSGHARSSQVTAPLPSTPDRRGQGAYFIVRDHNGQDLAYVYAEDKRTGAKPLTRD